MVIPIVIELRNTGWAQCGQFSTASPRIGRFLANSIGLSIGHGLIHSRDIFPSAPSLENLVNPWFTCLAEHLILHPPSFPPPEERSLIVHFLFYPRFEKVTFLVDTFLCSFILSSKENPAS